MGSGVVLFNVQPKKAIAADSNKHIIRFYKDIQNTDNPLRNYLIPECVCPKEKDILFPNYNNT
jgi:DNA adenine methylase